MASLNFNAEGIDTTNTFDAIPAGDYEAMVTHSEMRKTKDMTGEYLELTLEIQAGQYQGRKLWDRLNLANQNPKAVEIAQKQLAQLCHATGVMQVKNSEQLHNKPVIMKVAAKNDPQRGMQNEVKGYKARGIATQQAIGLEGQRTLGTVGEEADGGDGGDREREGRDQQAHLAGREIAKGLAPREAPGTPSACRGGAHACTRPPASLSWRPQRAARRSSCVTSTRVVPASAFRRNSSSMI
jgi:hypothetical protein